MGLERRKIMKKISVIIPVYNVKDYLDRCMETVLNSTYKNLEILVVDDGATDGSEKMCDKYAQMDERVKVIHKKNGGLSSARNAALEVMTGEYVAFVDSDDYIHSRMFEKLYEAAQKYSADVVICEHFVERGNKICIESYVEDEVIEYEKDEAIVALIKDKEIRNYAWNKLYSAEIFKEVRYPEGRNFEDIATAYLLFDKAKKIVKIPEYLYYYQIREGSISAHITDEKWVKNCKDIVLSQEERYRYFKNSKKDIADLCMKEMLPYIFECISKGHKLKQNDYVIFGKDMLDKYKQDILADTYIPESQKKLLNIYMGGNLSFRVFSKSKKSVKKLKGNIKRFNRKVLAKGLTGAGKYDFRLKEGKSKRIVFFELPCFDNLGDHAIAYATSKFIDSFIEKHPEYQKYIVEDFDTPGAVNDLNKVINKEDIICLQGGGNMGNLYSFADGFRKIIFNKFCKNRIVQFPQTLYFTNDDAGEKAKLSRQKEVNGCSNLLLCARDEVSYKKMKDLFDVEVIMMNDIVSYLDESQYASDDREGILLCLRSDKESALDAEAKKKLSKICEENAENVYISDTVTGGEVSCKDREKVLISKWKKFGKHELVVTDRLHGMIFSIITKTPCVIIGNNHHKVKETYRTFEKCEYIYFVENIDEVGDAIKKALSNKNANERYSCEEKFGKLMNRIIQ